MDADKERAKSGGVEGERCFMPPYPPRLAICFRSPLGFVLHPVKKSWSPRSRSKRLGMGIRWMRGLSRGAGLWGGGYHRSPSVLRGWGLSRGRCLDRSAARGAGRSLVLLGLKLSRSTMGTCRVSACKPQSNEVRFRPWLQVLFGLRAREERRGVGVICREIEVTPPKS